MRKFLPFLLFALLLSAGCNNDADKLKKQGQCPGCNLTNSYFKNAHFEGADLSKANLLGVTLDGARLKGANFEESFLFGTSLMGADLRQVNFKNATLVTTNFRNALIEGADFTGADLSGAIWLQGFRCQQGSIGVCYKSAMKKLDATNNCAGCVLFKAKLAGRVFKESNFEKAILHKADLRDTSFINSNLRFADLKGANIAGTDFSGSDLRGATWVDGYQCGDGSTGKCVPHTNSN